METQPSKAASSRPSTFFSHQAHRVPARLVMELSKVSKKRNVVLDSMPATTIATTTEEIVRGRDFAELRLTRRGDGRTTPLPAEVRDDNPDVVVEGSF